MSQAKQGSLASKQLCRTRELAPTSRLSLLHLRRAICRGALLGGAGWMLLMSSTCSRVPSSGFAAPVDIESRADAVIGARLWSGSFGGPGRGAEAHSVAVDGNGNAVVIGEFYDTLNFEGQCGSLFSASVTAVFVAKFSPDGTCQWAKTAAFSSPPPYNQWGREVAVDSDGNAYVVGSFAGKLDFGCPPPALQTTGLNTSTFSWRG